MTTPCRHCGLTTLCKCIARDGEVIRVSLAMSDAAVRSLDTDQEAAQRQASYDAYVDRVGNAWRTAGAKRTSGLVDREASRLAYEKRVTDAWRQPA